MIYPTTHTSLLDVIVDSAEIMSTELFTSMAPYYTLMIIVVIVLIIIFIKMNKRK